MQEIASCQVIIFSLSIKVSSILELGYYPSYYNHITAYSGAFDFHKYRPKQVQLVILLND